TRSAEASGTQSRMDLRQLRTSCQERSSESDCGWPDCLPERYTSAAPAPCGVTIYGRIPTATCPSATGSTSRTCSQAWITRQFGATPLATTDLEPVAGTWVKE